MATAQEDKVERKPSIVICALCQDRSKKPKLLLCQHSCCTECLLQLHGEVGEGKPFCCPKCQTDIEVGRGEIDAIPDNYLYDITQDAYGKVDYSEDACVSCSQVQELANATHKCLDCGDTFCQTCSQWHCRSTVTKHHVVKPLVELKEGKFKEEFATRKVLFCDLHSTDEKKVPLSSFCSKCRNLVCIECIQGDHKGHDLTNLHTAREVQQKILNDNFTNLQRSEKKHPKRTLNIENCIMNTKENQAHDEAVVYDRSNEIHAMVDRMKEEKLEELKSHYVEELKHLNGLLDEERYKQSSLEATVAFSQEFLEHSSDSDFLCHEKDVQTRMEASKKREKYAFTRNVLDIQKPDIETLSPVLKNVFGEMVPKKETIFHKCSIGEVKKVFSRKVRKDNIYGIAFDDVNKELILSGIGDRQALLALYENGRFKKYINCLSADKSDNVFIHNNEIFVTFYTQPRHFAIIDANRKIRKKISLPDDDNDSDWSLGIVVNKNNNTIFVSSTSTGRIYKMEATEDTLSTFLPKENGFLLEGPAYLCFTPSGELIVSNNDNIQTYSNDGEPLWQYNGEKEGNCLQSPQGVCCDKDGCIYVVDKDNCRIQVIHNKELIGNIPIDEQVKEVDFVPLLVTPEDELIYGYGDNLVKISFWN